MKKTDRAGGSENIKASEVSLTGLYIISVKAMAVGVAVVFLLNVTTPTGFIFERIADFKAAAGSSYAPLVVRRLVVLFLVILSIGVPSLFIMHALLRPVSGCLTQMRNALEVEPLALEKARRRIINLPFFFVGIYVCIWVLLPAVIFFVSYLIRLMDMRTAVVFSIRASMVGFITSSVAFYNIENYCRKGLIPLLFPDGRLAGLEGAEHLDIGRRIRLFYAIGTSRVNTWIRAATLTVFPIRQ